VDHQVQWNPACSPAAIVEQVPEALERPDLESGSCALLMRPTNADWTATYRLLLLVGLNRPVRELDSVSLLIGWQPAEIAVTAA
jgi:hypothetical protein